MKTAKFMLVMALTGSTFKGFAQDGAVLPPQVVIEALSADDSVKLATFITKANINDCYGNYSVLSHAVRLGAIKCFHLLITDSADVNKTCNDYVPPLMHAAKYGRLEMIKVLVAKGANLHYQYTGQSPELAGQTPLSYAQKFHKDNVVMFLQSLK